MQYFKSNGKHNWVDETNVVVGFDEIGECCARHGFFYSKDQPDDVPYDVLRCSLGEADVDLAPWRFVRNGSGVKAEHIQSFPGTDGGGAVIFELFNMLNNKKMFLTIFNAQSGYYSSEVVVGVPIKFRI